VCQPVTTANKAPDFKRGYVWYYYYNYAMKMATRLGEINQAAATDICRIREPYKMNTATFSSDYNKATLNTNLL